MCILFIESKRCGAFQCVLSMLMRFMPHFSALQLQRRFRNGKKSEKISKRAADDRQQDPSAANIDPRTEADIGRLVDKYKNRSESSLMDELLRVTEQQKRDGTLDSAGIQAAANSILPMLNAEQAKKLNAILSKIT